MANRELEHEGGEERPRRELTCFNLVRALLLYFLDLGMAVVLLPRGTPINLRNILIIFGKFLLHVTMMMVCYAFYLACLSNANVAPHGPISLSINRMLGLPDNPACRTRRELEDSWHLLKIDPISTSSSPPLASANSSAPNVTLPDLQVNLTEAFVPFSTSGDSASSSTILPPTNATWSNSTVSQPIDSTSSDFTTVDPGFFNDSSTSTTEAASANNTSSAGLLSSTLGLTTSSPANVTIAEGSSTTTTTEPTPPVAEDLSGFNLSTSNLALDINDSSVNATSETTDELYHPWFTEEEHKIIKRVLSLLYGLATVLILALSICCAGLGLVTLGERWGRKEALRGCQGSRVLRGMELRSAQRNNPSNGAIFEPAPDSLFRPIARDSSSFAPLQATNEEEL
jgi:hypothetical protein